MTVRKRARLEPTEDWWQLQLLTKWPEQMAYELIRPVVLWGETAGERARQTGENERTIDRKADSFDRRGMLGLFPARRRQPVEDPRSLPPPMRQLIVDLRAEVPEMSLREIAEVCHVRFSRRPSHLTVKKVLATGPAPSVTTRRYMPYHQIPDAVRRRLAIVRLHAEGWRVSTIARYLGTTRHTVYDTLKRWVEEQFAGMPDRSHVPKQPATKTTLAVVNEIRKLQENPELGEWRMHAALLQMGIDISPSTCGRIMARNRVLYGLDKSKRSPKQKKEMPYKAGRRHQYWSLDIRYIEKHKLGGEKPVYAVSAIENYSRALLASTISPTQDLVPVLMVLSEAFRVHGVPEAIVTDSGSVFRANRMVELCRALGIRRERID
jgi:transposase